MLRKPLLYFTLLIISSLATLQANTHKNSLRVELNNSQAIITLTSAQPMNKLELVINKQRLSVDDTFLVEKSNKKSEWHIPYRSQLESILDTKKIVLTFSNQHKHGKPFSVVLKGKQLEEIQNAIRQHLA